MNILTGTKTENVMSVQLNRDVVEDAAVAFDVVATVEVGQAALVAVAMQHVAVVTA